MSTGPDGDLSTCGCCEAIPERALDNLPGQPSLRWRVGTHSTFLGRMKASLHLRKIPDGALAGTLPLAALTTRAATDPSIAMLDACATACDVVAFYQERIIQEGYLRTATERRSVLELARALGYELNPGVAAGTYLAFTVEDAQPAPPAPALPGLPAPPPPILMPTTIVVPPGTKVQSVPGAGELPQTFETLGPLEARVAWNAMRPRRGQRQQLSIASGKLMRRDPAGTTTGAVCGEIWLEGTATGLQPGDFLVVHITHEHVDPSDPISSGGTLGGVVVPAVQRGLVVLVVGGVSTDSAAQRTRVELRQDDAQVAPRFGFPDREDATITTDSLPLDADAVRTRVLEKEWEEGTLAAFLAAQRWDDETFIEQVEALVTSSPRPADVYAFRQRTGVFGNAAPPHKTLDAQKDNPWTNYEATTIWMTSGGAFHSDDGPDLPDLYLDRTVNGLVAGGLVGLKKPKDAVPTIFAAAAVTEASLADFAISGRATGLRLHDEPDKTRPVAEWKTALTEPYKNGPAGAAFLMRTTSVLVQSEALELAQAPIDDPVADAVVSAGGVTWAPASSVMLDRLVPGLARGRVLALSGSTVDAGGAPTGAGASELATLERVVHTGGYTVLHFTKPLQHRYDRASLTICANVARATHGETQPLNRTPPSGPEEILGSGNGAVPNQRFTLKKPPLTYVSAATPSGGTSTLVVRVDGVEWTEVGSLFGQPPTARVYTVRMDDDGTTVITFGDGRAGSRLPTGTDNVTAAYRSGIGTAGEVGAGRIMLLLSKPPGLKSAINPVAASGSQDPETLEQARTSAALTVRTLDRVVSLSDYEDFARGFSGVGKAQAVAVWSGHTRLVHITVASATGGVLDPLSDVYLNLLSGIAEAGDPSQPVQVDSFSPRLFKLDVTILCDPAFDRDAVRATARSAVEGAFTFERRAFAQPVTDAEIMAILHGVAGVKALRIGALYPAEQTTPSISGVLTAAPARFDAAEAAVLPAELLLLGPAGLSLTVVHE